MFTQAVFDLLIWRVEFQNKHANNQLSGRALMMQLALQRSDAIKANKTIFVSQSILLECEARGKIAQPAH